MNINLGYSGLSRHCSIFQSLEDIYPNSSFFHTDRNFATPGRRRDYQTYVNRCFFTCITEIYGWMEFGAKISYTTFKQFQALCMITSCDGFVC